MSAGYPLCSDIVLSRKVFVGGGGGVGSQAAYLMDFRSR